jgi:hypothetical protein
MTTKSPKKKILQGFCIKKVKANKTMKGWAVQNHRKKKARKYRVLDSTAHNQTLK